MPVPLAVLVAGGVGALARYGIDGVVRERLGTGFPWGTFAVNVAGSLVIGILFASVAVRPDVPDWVRIGLTTGLLGGFTTFSAFSLETHRLLEDGSYGLAAAYVVGTVAAGIAAVTIGVLLGRAS